jgi:hypothetical protein
VACNGHIDTASVNIVTPFGVRRFAALVLAGSLIALPFAASADQVLGTCQMFTCDGGNGSVSVGGHQDGGTGANEPVSSGPEVVVVVHHCGPRIPLSAVLNAVGADCMSAVLACPLATGATADLNFESTATVSTNPDGTSNTVLACDVPTGAAPQVTAADIEQWVVKQLPVGQIGTPDAKSLVNLKTVFWLDAPATKEWGPLTIIQAGVRIRATLASVHWDFGDGTTDATEHGGRPYDPAEPCDATCDAYFGHTYTDRTGPMAVSAQAFWTAEFSVNGGAFVALPAPVPADAAPPRTVTIAQARSQLISGND